LVLADTEHYTHELFAHVAQHTPFDLLAPMPNSPTALAALHHLPAKLFRRHWVGYATTVQNYQFGAAKNETYYQYIQRLGERSSDYEFKAFLGTARRPEVDDLTKHFPQRWRIEEFFNAEQALGWNRAGTQNLNIRYGQMTTALLAQAATHQFRERLGAPYNTWDAKHLAKDVFRGLNGDIRVEHQTIVVTLYDPPNAEQLRTHYENLPFKLAAQGVDPRVPWLYNFKLDFRFR
jgi:hypothetical protein